MKILKFKFLQFVVFSMAGGLVASLFAAVGCCAVFLFILIPILPIVFISSWIFGSVAGWITVKNAFYLPEYSYVWSTVGFTVISFLLLHLWLYPHNLRYCIGYTGLSAIGFAVCSLPVVIYFKKKTIPEIFIPPLPKCRKKNEL